VWEARIGEVFQELDHFAQPVQLVCTEIFRRRRGRVWLPCLLCLHKLITDLGAP